MNNNVQHGGRQGAKSQPGRGESNMASEHKPQLSHAKPMRAAAAQSDNASRFQVAGHEPGGMFPQQHHHHHSKQPEGIPTEQPIEHTDQQQEHRNQASKGFVYKDEDFQPLKSSSTPHTTKSPMTDAHTTDASNVSQKSASAKSVPQVKSYSQATSYASSMSSPLTQATQDKRSAEHDKASAEELQSHTDATRHHHHHHHHGSKQKHDDDSMHHRHVAMHESLARDDAPTPEMHLETLFPEEDADRSKPQVQKASALSSTVTSAQAGQPLRDVSNATPPQNEGDSRTDHREKPSVSPELNQGTLFSESKAGGSEADHRSTEAEGYVFHPPTLARDHDSRHEHSAHSQAAPAHDPMMQKMRHVPAQRPEYHAPAHTPQPQQATIERASASREQTSQTPSSAPPKKKTWYGVEVPVKQKTSSPKPNAGSKHPLSLGFGFKEIRKVAKAGQSRSSGPSSPVSSSDYKQKTGRVNVPLQNAPLHEDLSKPTQPVSSQERSSLDSSTAQPVSDKPTQTATGSRTHQVLGQPYEEPQRAGAVPKSGTARETHEQGDAVATAEHALQVGLGGIRSLVGAAMQVPAMVAHALLPDDDDEEQETTTSAQSHDRATLGSRKSMKRGHSKAVMLKRPRQVDLTLYPEEDPSYPRGDGALHENPACPAAASLKASAGERAAGHDQSFHALSAGLLKKPGHTTSQPRPSANSSSNISAGTRPEHAYNHSKAVALKKPAQNVMLFEEEDGSYPRDSSHRQHKNPDQPPHIVDDVHEVQLDAAHLHPHHDLHPTMGESAAAAIASGVEGMRAMLSGIKLHYISDTLLAPEGRSHERGQQHSHQRRHSNPAAGAVLSGLGRSSQSTQQWNAQGREESFSHRGDAYFGQHGDQLTGHIHAATKPNPSSVSATKVPLETGHRGDAYYGQHGDMPKTGFKNDFPLEAGHRGDAYFGQHEAQGPQSSIGVRSTGPIYSPASSPVPTNVQRNFPIESRHRGDAYYGQYDDTAEARQGNRLPAQSNPYPAAVQQIEHQQLEHQRQQGPLADEHAPSLQSRPVQQQSVHRPEHTPSSRQGLPEYANAFPSAVQTLETAELNRPQKPVPTVSPAVVLQQQQQAHTQQSRAQQQQNQQQQQGRSLPPEHANVYASAVRRTEQEHQQQQQQQQQPQQQQQQQQQGHLSQQEPLNEGEKVVWVKKVKVTEEFYDDDDDGLDRNAAHPPPPHGNSQLPHQHQEQTVGRRQPSGPAQ
ncbi:hypothetical protein EC968_004908 [Mortierella alpina]|nr:hypothetical protein EC968_004908 [Mortierella alpina]